MRVSTILWFRNPVNPMCNTLFKTTCTSTLLHLETFMETRFEGSIGSFYTVVLAYRFVEGNYLSMFSKFSVLAF